MEVVLVYVDTKSDIEEAKEAAATLKEEGVSLVLGSYGNSVSIAAGDIFKEAKHTQLFESEEIDENSNLLLLSTCTYEYKDARGVLVGIIEPKIEKQE